MKDRIKNITQKVKDHERVIWVCTVIGLGTSLVVMTRKYNYEAKNFDRLGEAIIDLEIVEDVLEQVYKNRTT